MLDLATINKEWTLFLDRDGVINVESPLYIFTPEEFVFYDGVKEALRIVHHIFGTIVVTTNQRGIGRGLMTDEDLAAVHAKMITEIVEAGGRIDRIYYCPANDDADPNRKPNPGMALQAMRDFPQIDPSKSLIVGNHFSDMKFGRNAGINTVLLTTTGTRAQLPDSLVDLQFDSLIEFARAIG